MNLNKTTTKRITHPKAISYRRPSFQKRIPISSTKHNMDLLKKRGMIDILILYKMMSSKLMKKNSTNQITHKFSKMFFKLRNQEIEEFIKVLTFQNFRGSKCCWLDLEFNRFSKKSLLVIKALKQSSLQYSLLQINRSY